METFIQWWRALANRERQMVVAAAAILLLALGYLVAFEPAWVGRQKLAKELPQLRAQLAQMDALSSEARRISGAGSNNESPASLRQAVEASVASAGLKPYMTQGNFQGDLIEVKFNAAPFAVLATWLAATVRETRVRVVDANVQREATAGLVTAKFAFELPKRESR
jgi:general secretion pathway protein M